MRSGSRTLANANTWLASCRNKELRNEQPEHPCASILLVNEARGHGPWHCGVPEGDAPGQFNRCGWPPRLSNRCYRIQLQTW